ncbi:hypothetical protein WKK05_23690 [Nostoc sp. UHCC 0302]|uniref:hypothetical protein n=1 Tax=Nostoc sp. UHCC 0302 TaxID=3134896 RepID=UPI00311CC8B0
MTQNPLNDSSTQSPKTPGLKPALASALASLEVQLDQELARYRRARTGFRIPKQPPVGSYISGKSQQLPLISTTSAKTQPAVAVIKTNPPLASIPVNSQRNSIPATVKNDTSSAYLTVNSQASPDPTTAKSASSVSLTVNSQPNPALAITKTEELDKLKLSSITEPVKTQIPPPPPSPNSGSIVPAAIKATKSQNLLQPDSAPKQPDDYLESSEALLRSLTEEQLETKKPSNSGDSLLSPLGIGSMLLLLLASLTLGYVVFNPKTLPQLNLSKLFNSDSSLKTENTQQVETNTEPQSQPQITSIPKYPNLAAKEFPEVRDPNDVVGLKPKAQPTPITAANPIPNQNLRNPQAVLPNPITAPNPTDPTAITPVVPGQPLPPLNLPPTSTATTSPQPNETPAQPIAEIKPGADGFYHVVTDNQGKRALASARKIIPDAYLSPDKKYIYLGAVKTPEQLERQLRLLESKGIKARVEEP